MKDRAMQALHLLALNPVAEVHADPNSYGFRPYRSAHDALAQCFNVLSRPDSAVVVFDADIRACFDRISHEWLKLHVPMDKRILSRWLAAGYLEEKALFPTTEGTPQGGIISPVLANWTLDGLERVAQEAAPRRSLVNVVRYADDFVVTARSDELLATRIVPAISAFLADRGLELHPEKSRITTTEAGFDFLGVTVRRYGRKLLMKPSRRSVSGFLDGIRGTIEAHRSRPLRDLIGLLNPRIRGWANYFRGMVASRVFNQVDNAIYDAMRRWMRRRHPDKSLSWLGNRYFRSDGHRRWILTAGPVGPRGTYLDLFRASSVAIRRHVKVPSEATAFDPEFQAYFRQRRATREREAKVERTKMRSMTSRRPTPRTTRPGHGNVAPGRA
jgi:RNA-directed DNA polymerase